MNTYTIFFRNASGEVISDFIDGLNEEDAKTHCVLNNGGMIKILKVVEGIDLGKYDSKPLAINEDIKDTIEGMIRKKLK